MECKGSGGSDEEYVRSNHLPELILYVKSSYFRDGVDSFIQRHLHQFECFSDSKSPDSELQTVEHMETFLGYQRLVNSLIDEFADKQRIDADSLFRNCREALQGDFMPLFEEDPNKEFVEEILSSWLEYECFLQMMCSYTRKSSKYSHK